MITVKCTIDAPIEQVWNLWTTPEHIKNWNNASEDWHTPHAENDLRIGGKFKFTMASKDGTISFNFEGEYTKVENHSLIEYKLGARGLRSLCEAILTDAMYELPSSDDKKLEIDVEYAKETLNKNLLKRLEIAS
jgi:uncharacterized protein YndB with AHSA1/START domain